jgi:YD repeat-containing protein
VHTNAKGQTRTTVNNVHGKPARVTDALGGTIEHRYNAMGTLVETVDAEGHSITLEYDALGHKTAMTDPNFGHWTYAYNAYGQLTSQTDAKGQTTTISYDALGRKITRTSADGTSRWVYDNQYMAVGKPISLTTHDNNHHILHRKSYNYDHLGRSWRAISKIGGHTQMIVSSEYDNHSRLSKRTYPNNHQLDYHYNQYGHLTKITSPNGLSVDGYSIEHLQDIADQALDIAAQSLDNSINWSQQASAYYDQAVSYQQADPSLEQSAEQLDKLAEQALSQAETYLHYAAHPQQLAAQLQDQSTVYTALGQDSANITYWQALQYDAMGRNSQYLYGNGLVTDRHYNPAGQLTEINTGFGFHSPMRQLTYEYDANNNITRRSDQLKDIHESFGYDALDRLTSVQSNAADILINQLAGKISHWDNRIAQVAQLITQLASQQQQQTSQLANIQSQLQAIQNDDQALQNIKTQLDQMHHTITDQQHRLNHLRGQRDYHRNEANHHYGAISWWNWWYHLPAAWYHASEANSYQHQLDSAQQTQNNHYDQRNRLRNQQGGYHNLAHYQSSINLLSSQQHSQQLQLDATHIKLGLSQVEQDRYQAQQLKLSQQQQSYQQQIDGANDQLASTSLLATVQCQRQYSQL